MKGIVGQVGIVNVHCPRCGESVRQYDSLITEMNSHLFKHDFMDSRAYASEADGRGCANGCFGIRTCIVCNKSFYGKPKYDKHVCDRSQLYV